MADYIYLLESRLTPAQREALKRIRDVARTHGVTVFLVGGAVRDLTSGVAIRDIDVAVQGNALKLKKDLEKAGAKVVGSNDTFQSLHLSFPGGVRAEVSSTLLITYPKPGKPVARMGGILDDLRSRDFTANAMAVSLNDGSYGLLMDPLNGVADIENRELRLVSNYGFIEDPSRMIRAARLSSRLGWALEERTQQRYDTGKAENYIDALGSWERSYELEEIFHEEDPLRIARRLESEGWMKILFPQWTAAKANEAEVERLRDEVGRLNVAGIYPDPSAAFFPLLTAKLGAKEASALKQAFARPGFVEEIESLEGRTKALATQFSSKEYASPSAAWKLLYSADPQAVLSLVYGTKSNAVKQRFEQFFNEWPQARNRIPYALMQEMRITSDLSVYNDLIDKLFFVIMDAKLETPEAARAFLEPYSPPAPPPPPNLRRRPAKRETRASKKAPKAAAAAAPEGSAAAANPAAAKGTKVASTAADSIAGKPAGKAPTAPAKKATPVSTKTPAKASRPAEKPLAKKAAPARKAAKAAPKPVKKAAAKKAPAKKPAGKSAKPKSKPAAKKAATKPAPRKAVRAKKKAAKPAKKSRR
ncbi:MAG TPA: CCA tRNA nucleotidyltransferase [Acidobacteriaceae bacterium]|nr:CCA tRNA nucleotidyltransferase [Acidobacteriaceae bacterium]